jgi:hypothetical protein
MVDYETNSCNRELICQKAYKILIGKQKEDKLRNLGVDGRVQQVSRNFEQCQ